MSRGYTTSRSRAKADRPHRIYRAQARTSDGHRSRTETEAYWRQIGRRFRVGSILHTKTLERRQRQAKISKLPRWFTQGGRSIGVAKHRAMIEAACWAGPNYRLHRERMHAAAQAFDDLLEREAEARRGGRPKGAKDKAGRVIKNRLRPVTITTAYPEVTTFKWRGA